MPARIPLNGECDPWDLALQLSDEPRCVAFIGEWSAGGAVLADRPSRIAEDPFRVVDEDRSGAWAGWWGYAAGEFDLARYDHVVVLDVAGRWWVERTNESAAVDDSVVERWQRRLDSAGGSLPFRVGPPRAETVRARHIGIVEETVLAIAAGDFFQANACLRLTADFTGSPLGLWCTAGRRLRPQRAAFVGRPDGAVASLSPETLLTRVGSRATTRPIKGTRPLTEAGRRELIAARKDAAEHVMIVDLVRNDLARVARPGSVCVERFLDPRPLAGVWHLESAVAADVEAADGEVLRALLPPGSVTGAPKTAAVSWCAAVEERERIAYCGAVGFSSPVHGLQANVAIRTVEIEGERLWLGVGGGIVADSDPAQEWAECRAKAAPILSAVDAPMWSEPDPGSGPADRPVFETILVNDGVPVDLAGHADRIAASRGVDRVEFRRTVTDHAAGLGSGHFRLRAEDDLTMTSAPIPRPAVLRGELESLALRSYQLPGRLGGHKWSDRTDLVAAEKACDPAEPLLCEGSEVLETSRANVFALIDGIWRTPALDGRVLPGLVRRVVLDLIVDSRPEPGSPAALRIGPLPYSDIVRSEAVIVTNSLRGIWWVRQLDDIAWTSPPATVRDLATALGEVLSAR
ncbi:MAG TPA: chorismate-binding protein [Mycobacteriales bacterium]|nr:chorismate-binding protein [Mycobacteriales bacterium]